MRDYPLTRVSVFFISGIVMQKFFCFPGELYLFSIPVLLLIISLSLVFKFYQRFIPVISSVLCILILLSGALVYTINRPRHVLLSPKIQSYKNVKVYGKISQIELIRADGINFIMDIDSAEFSEGMLKKKIKLLCKLQHPDKADLFALYNTILPGYGISLRGDLHKAREMRNPGEFDYNKYLNSLGISGTLASYHADSLKIINAENNIYQSFIFNIRKDLDQDLQELHNPETAKFLKGLLLGDRGEIDYEIKTGFINSGVVHVLSVSGLHVGYVILIFLIVFGRLGIYLRAFLTIAGIIFFMMITGNPVAMFRASVMGGIFITAFVLNRSANVFNSLALSALIILTLYPEELFSPAFQLSFSAVASMGVLYPLISRKISALNIKWNSVKNFLLLTALSLSAQIGTLPFTLFYFGKLSLVAVFTNLFVIPVTGLITGIGILSLLLNSILPSIAVYYGAANDLAAAILFQFVKLTGDPGYSFLWVRNFSAPDALIFYLFMTYLIFYSPRLKGYTAKMFFWVLIIANLLLFISYDDKEYLPLNRLSVFALDVGNGDAILIKFPDGRTALIDAGDATAEFDNGERIIIPLLDHLGIGQVDYGFISHLDSDHYAGFVSLIKNKRIKKIFKHYPDPLSSDDVRFETFIKKEKINVEYYDKQSLRIGNSNLFILYDKDDPFYNGKGLNNKSSVIKLNYGKTSFLFTGDIEKEAENHFLKKYGHFLKTDLLKVAHHGSSTSSTAEFLNSAAPEKCLISAGIDNKFGFPSPEVLGNLNSVKAEVYRTDLSGGLLFQSDGDSIIFINWRIN